MKKLTASIMLTALLAVGGASAASAAKAPLTNSSFSKVVVDKSQTTFGEASTTRVGYWPH